MDTIEFAVRPLVEGRGALAVVPLVNGDELAELVAAYERSRGYDVINGYDGIVPSHYRFGPLGDYFLGASDATWGADGSKIAVLGCACGEVGCWPGCVRVDVTAQAVRWSDFEQPHRPDRDYAEFGTFEFDRSQYDQAVQSAIEALDVRSDQ